MGLFDPEPRTPEEREIQHKIAKNRAAKQQKVIDRLKEARDKINEILAEYHVEITHEYVESNVIVIEDENSYTKIRLED